MYQEHFKQVSTWFQVDHSCLTIDKGNPQLCPNSAPFCHPVSVVDNSACYSSIQAISIPVIINLTLYNGRKLKNLKKYKKCGILSPCKMLLTSPSKHFVQISRGLVTGT